MKRTFICFWILISLVLAVVGADLFFMTRLASGMTDRLDRISREDLLDKKKEIALELDRFYDENSFWAHRVVPTDRLDEIEMLLHKLNAYMKEEDYNEIEATASELRARVNLLYSTNIYHWYHPFRFRIE